MVNSWCFTINDFLLASSHGSPFVLLHAQEDKIEEHRGGGLWKLEGGTTTLHFCWWLEICPHAWDKTSWITFTIVQ